MSFSKNRLEEIISENGTIFRNREVFAMEYLPELYKYRDKQLEKMAFFSRNIHEGLAPHHMLLLGPFATGKTSTVNYYFQLLQETYSSKVDCVHINCQFMDTSYKILSKTYSELSNIPTTKTGISTTILFEKIIKQLKNEDKILIIALDDYNYIKTPKELNKLLYKLLRVHEQYPNIQISVFLITNKEEYFAFNPDVVTMLDPITVSFDPYTYPQTYQILKQRCRVGFIKGTVSKEVLQKITDYTRDQGDLRDGIRMLSHAGEKAEIHGLSKITEDCLY
jgi:cell division control protein 6